MFCSFCDAKAPNMVLNLASFGRWTLREAAQPRSARWLYVMHEK